MNRKELYHKSVDTLLDAYNNGDLVHGTCTMCAVGNLCAAASLETDVARDAWGYLFLTRVDSSNVFIDKMKYELEFKTEAEAVNAANKLIAATGYTVDELMKIERAFESSVAFEPVPLKGYKSPADRYVYWTYYENQTRGQFIGLCAVLKVLAEIHAAEISDSETSQHRLEEIAVSKYAVEV